MRGNNILGILFANVHDEKVHELTEARVLCHEIQSSSLLPYSSMFDSFFTGEGRKEALPTTKPTRDPPPAQGAAGPKRP